MRILGGIGCSGRKEPGNPLHYNISRLYVIVAALGALLIFGAGGNVANASPGGPLVIAAKKTLCEHGFTYSTPTVLIPNIEGYEWAEWMLNPPTRGWPTTTVVPIELDESAQAAIDAARAANTDAAIRGHLTGLFRTFRSSPATTSPA
ncbi:hypothetical protein AB0L63_10255 [Nocardia sp. NPDC051990]|uniref:hypothetical protein n=1 Tax=Nocardia sp. NPDC051990 TaxID=3155285 RepID=UPI003428E3C7